jgi:multidrug efflux pump subunit AcrA (membrane-fusion protein)
MGRGRQHPERCPLDGDGPDLALSAAPRSVSAVAIVRAWDSFSDYRTDYASGTMMWEVAEGDAVEPGQGVGTVEAGKRGEGMSMHIGVDHFGKITKLLVPEGASVVPGQPLLEYDQRPPTTDEYNEQYSAAFRAERRIGDLTAVLRNPFRAFWASLTRSYRR